MRYDTRLTDTIAALATPFGRSALAVIRLSGPRAFVIANACMKLSGGAPFKNPKGYRAYRVTIVSDADAPIDDAVAIAMRAPKSYTGEDAIDIVSHGAPVIVETILKRCIALGARLAEKGEFTRRAYLNGKVTLSQAEAVHDLIMSENAFEAEQNVKKLSGTFTEEITQLREKTKALLMTVEGAIDFPEDDTGECSAGVIETQAHSIQRAISDTLEKGTLTRAMMQGKSVVIAGPTNAGKSSLFNALIGEERAIVAEIAGTTRDALYETLYIEGLPFRVFDTAGIRDAVDSEIETMGIERTKTHLQNADIALVVLDQSNALTDEARAALSLTRAMERVIALNKSDLPCALNADEFSEGSPVVSVSAKTGEGLPELKRAIYAKGIGATKEAIEQTVYVNARETSALQRAHDRIARFLSALKEDAPLDALAFELHEAEKELAHTLGAITNEEVINALFDSFCIGK